MFLIKAKKIYIQIGVATILQLTIYLVMMLTSGVPPNIRCEKDSKRVYHDILAKCAMNE